MNSAADSADLLRDYARTGADIAFAALVHRHLDLVYSAAFRRGGQDAALAADVAQTVFTDLARKARSTRPEEAGAVLSAGSLAGWLYRHTCFVAATAVRGESRRRAREKTAMQLQTQTDSTDWSRVAPVLEEAMAELPDSDRDALVRRFFEKETFAHIGATLGASEDAARMRVERALDRLRDQLARRGVTSTAAALASSLTAFGVTPAPAGLAATVAGTATAAVAISAATASAPFIAFKPLAVGIAAVLAVTALLTGIHFTRDARARLSVAERDRDALSSEFARLQAGTDALRSSVVSPDELARLRQEHAELLRLRGEVTRLRRELTDSASARTADTNAAANAGDASIAPVQVLIEGRFIELPDDALRSIRGLNVPINGNGLFSEESAKVLLKQFEHLEGVEILAAPRVITLGGRPAQMSVQPDLGTDAATGIATKPSVFMEVMAYVDPGTRQVELRMRAGYEAPADAGNGATAAPIGSMHEARVLLWDGQSVLLRQPAQRREGADSAGAGPRSLLVMVTPTCVDPTGKRLFPSDGTNQLSTVPDQSFPDDATRTSAADVPRTGN